VWSVDRAARQAEVVSVMAPCARRIGMEPSCPHTLPSGLLRATWPVHHGCGLMESLCMQPRITLITLGVDDLETAVRFYRDVTGCEFSVAQELLVMAKVEGNSGIRGITSKIRG